MSASLQSKRLIHVTLTIEPTGKADDENTASIAERLVTMGGRIVSWYPDMNGAPARAVFRFETEDEREDFLVGALALRGVSVAVH